MSACAVRAIELNEMFPASGVGGVVKSLAHSTLKGRDHTEGAGGGNPGGSRWVNLQRRVAVRR